jgi:hypothetical protein
MPPVADWRSAAAYVYLDDLDPAELAWEFLRRNPDYQRDYRTAAGETAAQAEFPEVAARVDAALRLWRIATGRPRRQLPDRLTHQRRHRLELTLRALDGRLAGKSYRLIAQSLFGAARIPTGHGWKTHELRDRTIRLARAGSELMQDGYLDLLRYPRPQRE